MKRKKESFFWTSYSDLMTSLFFIMLVLFVLVIVLLHKRMEMTTAELNAMKEIIKSTDKLDKKYFRYENDYKKFVLNVKCEFPVKGYDINNMLADSTKQQLYNAGLSVKGFLDEQKKNYPDTRYLVIIEGQASRNSESWMDFNYDLSFKRALSLIKYWRESKINFEDSNCEIQIAGSGDGRLNANTMREKDEPKNQRFLIYLIPKNIIQNENK